MAKKTIVVRMDYEDAVWYKKLKKKRKEKAKKTVKRELKRKLTRKAK